MSARAWKTSQLDSVGISILGTGHHSKKLECFTSKQNYESVLNELAFPFQDVEKEVIAAVLGQGLLESERLVHLMDDCRIRPEAPPKITTQV